MLEKKNKITYIYDYNTGKYDFFTGMEDFLNKINFSLIEFKFAKLDSRWNTENFHLPQLGIPYARLYYPVEGEGYIMLNGEKHILKPGEIYLIAPYAPVIVDCPKHLVKYWGHFNAFILDSPLDIFSFAEPIMKISDDSPDFNTALFKILCSKETQRDIFAKMEKESALTLILMPFLKNNTSVSGQKFTRFTALLSYIEKHMDKGLTLCDLADFSGLNPTYLSNLFAAEMGIPLMKYCNQRAIHRAIDLIWCGKYTFAEIAYRCGAENVTAFSRLFKKYTGFTPREMQKLINSVISSV